MEKKRIFKEMGIICKTYNPDNPDDCGYGECFYEDEKGQEIKTVVVDVLPHLHDIKTSYGKDNNNNVKNYLLEQIEECKNDNHQTVLNIFFEALIGTEFSFLFAQNPKRVIDITNELDDPSLKQEALNELQFKKPLMEECWKEEKRDEEIENVKIRWIPVPGMNEKEKLKSICNNILTEVNTILKNCNTKEWDYIDILYLIRDMELNINIQDFHPYLNGKFPKNNKKKEEIIKKVESLLKETGSIMIETREYLSILTMIDYINKQKIQENEVHKYFLVFGKGHQFYRWNDCDLTSYFKKDSIMVKFVRNTPMHSNNASCPINKVVKSALRNNTSIFRF